MRGYFCVGLFQPKTTENVGSALRATWLYDGAMLVTTGNRYKPVSTDTMKSYRHLPLMQAEDLFDVIPYNCVPVAIDLIDGAEPLPNYKHPERAYYIFGPEDGTLGKKITDKCRDKVFIPIKSCMNLAATVNVVLYDRMVKNG